MKCGSCHKNIIVVQHSCLGVIVRVAPSDRISGGVVLRIAYVSVQQRVFLCLSGVNNPAE